MFAQVVFVNELGCEVGTSFVVETPSPRPSRESPLSCVRGGCGCVSLTRTLSNASLCLSPQSRSARCAGSRKVSVAPDPPGGVGTGAAHTRGA